MKTKLVVTAAFSRRVGEAEERTTKDYPVGAEISDPAEMKAVRATHPHHVVARDADPPEGDPEHKPEPAAKAGALTTGAATSDKT